MCSCRASIIPLKLIKWVGYWQPHLILFPQYHEFAVPENYINGKAD